MAGRVIGEAFVTIRPDAAGFGNELQKAIQAQAQAAIQQISLQINQGVGGALNQAGKQADGLGGKLKGLAAAAAGLFAGVQVGQFLKEGIDQAADLGESVNAISVVLGDAAADFIEFGKTAANELGITQAELNNALVPMASLLGNAGLQGEALSDGLADVATRATDVASVFNKDVTEVLDAFGAAVRGETEPIRALGVNFDAAAVSAKAVELGLASSTKEVDNAAATQARLALVMEQTNKMAGDFANTSNSLPNLMKRFTATLDETKGALGQGLLPVLSEVLQSLMPAITALVPVFAQVGAALAPIVGGIGEAIQRLAPMIGWVFQDIAKAVAPLAELFPALAETLAPVIGTIGNLIATLLPPVLTVITAIVQAMDPFVSFFASVVNTVLDAFGPVLMDVATIIGQLAMVFVDAMSAIRSDGGLELVFESIGDTLAEVAPVLTETAQILAGVLGQAFRVLAPVLAEIITLVARFVEQALKDLAPFLPKLAQLFGRLVQALLPLLPIILDVAQIFLEALQPVLPQLAASFVLIVEALLPLIPPLVSLIEIIAPLAPILLGLALIIGGPATAGGFLLGLIGMSAILQEIGPLFADVAQAVGGFFVDAFGWAVDAIWWFLKFYFTLPKMIFDTAFNIGRSLIGGIVDGAQAVLGWIADLGRGIANTLIGMFNWAIQTINNFIPNSVGLGPVSFDLPDNPLPLIPQLARGGVTGSEGLVNVHPNEAILPLESAGGQAALAAALAAAGAGGGVTLAQGAVLIEVNVNGSISEDEARRTGAAVGDGFMDTVERRSVRNAVRMNRGT